MLKKLFFTGSLVLSFAFGGSAVQAKEIVVQEDRNLSHSAVTVGLLNGAGLLGAEFEYLVNDRIGLQAGTSFTGYDVALNYHLKPGARSSSLSFGYMHSTFAKPEYEQKTLQLSYLHRNPGGIFTATIGLGYSLGRGAELERIMTEAFNTAPPEVYLVYSIGAYFPQ